MGSIDEARQRLAQAIADRRHQLGLSVSAAARAADRMDRATWTAAERGTRETEDYNFARIERALRWAPGSISAILAGGTANALEPAATPPPTVDPEIELVRTDPNLTDQMRVRIIGLIYERRARERDAGLAETKRIIEVMRDQAAS